MITALFLAVMLAFTVIMHVIVLPNWWILILWLALGYLVASLFAILFMVIQLPILRRLSLTNKYKHYAYRSTAYFLNRFILRLSIEVEGEENIPFGNRLTIYSNHKSYVDPVVMMEVITRPTSYTPKMGVYQLPVMKTLLKSMGAFPIDRSSDRNTARAMVDAIKVVKQGVAMVIYPEGGIKDRNDIRMVAMRAGAYRLAVKAEADLLPISMIGTTDVKKRWPFRKTKIKVVIHELVKFESIEHMKTQEMADYMFQIINEPLNDVEDE